MIEQQYYTRERGGLFTQTDGYDTVAKSPMLKLDYIKKNLHPICSYDIPSELHKVGEQNETKYPPNFMIIPISSGELIVGQAIYKAKDFTGLRSTFFMHNYVLSETEKRRYIKEPEKLFGITSFATGYEIEQGRELPTLAAIPYDGNKPYFLDREKLFSKLEITDEIFHKLIFAAFGAAYSKKKIFIALNVEIEELGEMAKALLYHLYTVLPWDITEGLGVSTYASKAEPKKNIQITFLDKNTLRYDSKSKDFIFDFVNKKFMNIEGDIEGEPFIKLAGIYSKIKNAWEKINYWAGALGKTLKDKSEWTIGFYSRVIVLFELHLSLKSGKAFDLSEPKIRKGLLKQTLAYLQSDIGDDVRKDLFDILDYMIDLIKEEINQGKLPEAEEVKTILAFKLGFCKNREQEAHCIQILLQLLTLSSRNKDYAYVFMLLEKTHAYPKAYVSLFEEIFQSDELRKQVAYYLINESFKEVKTLDELIEQMAKFEEIESVLIRDHYYVQLVYDTFCSCMKNAKGIFSFLEKLQKWCTAHKSELYTNLLEGGEHYFLECMSLSDIENEQMLCNLKFSKSYALENYRVITDYQNLKTDLSYMSPRKIQVNNKVQELIKKFNQKQVKKQDFYMLVYAFLEKSSGSHEYKLNLKKVLVYLNQISKETLLDFIIWAKGQEMYIEKDKFDKEVVQFFVTCKQKGEKPNKEMIKNKLAREAKTKVLSEKVIEALKPAGVKWLSKHWVLAFCMVILTGAIIGGGLGVYFYQQNQKLEQTLSTQTVNPEVLKKLMPDFKMNEEKVNKLIEENFTEINEYKDEENKSVQSTSEKSIQDNVKEDNKKEDNKDSSKEDSNKKEDNKADSKKEEGQGTR